MSICRYLILVIGLGACTSGEKPFVAEPDTGDTAIESSDIAKFPVIEITPNPLIFDSFVTAEKRQETKSFTLTNSGTGPLRILSAEFSTEGTEFQASSGWADLYIVQPSESKEFDVVFRPNEFEQGRATARIESDDPNMPIFELEILERD